MKHRVQYLASFVAVATFVVFANGCSGDGGSAVPTDSDSGVVSDPNANQGASAGDSPSASNGNLGDDGNGTTDTGDSGTTEDRDSGISQEGDGGPRDGDAAAPGNRPDAAAGNARAFGQACTRDVQCASGACTRNGGGGAAGYCSVQCTPTNEATLCTKPLTTGKCVRGFCGKP